MKEKPLVLKWLTDNFVLKLMSVLIAAILWFIVTNINDPVISRSFYNVPVSIRNAAVLSEAGQVYEVLDGSDQIATVTVTAQRSVVETFTRDNIIAIADMNDLTSRNTIPIHLSVNKNTNVVVSVEGSIEDVRLNVEDRKTRTISLNVKTTGELAEGYIVGDVTPAQNLVRISGPASRVDQVARAEAEVDVTGFTSAIGTEADIRLYDSDDNQLRDTVISQNIASVRVQIAILNTKFVPLRVRQTGTPAEGYQATGEVQIEPAQVMIAGDNANVDNLNELVLAGEELDISGRTENLVVETDVKRLLPSGVRLADIASDGTVRVTIEILPVVTSQVEIPVEQLTVQNMPEDVQYALYPRDARTIMVTLSGLENEISQVEPGHITLTADIGAAIAASGAEDPQSLNVQTQVTVEGAPHVTGSATLTFRAE